LLLTAITGNGLRLGEGGDFHHKCACGALNHHFCQSRVGGSFYLITILYL